MALSAASRKLLSLPRLPVVRAGTLLLLVGLLVALGVYLYLHQAPPAARPPDPVLGGEVQAVMENFRHLVTQGGKDKLLVTASVDKWYENGTHELSGVEITSFGSTAERKDKIASDACVYNPENAIILFTSNVKVDTTDGLHVETDKLRYNQETSVVEIENAAKYARPNLDGTCRGAILETNDERLHMLADVDMTFHSEDKKPGDAGGSAAGSATGSAPEAGDAKPKKKKGGGGGKHGGGGGKKKRAAAAAAAAAGGTATAGGAAAEPAIDFANGPKIPVRIRSAKADFDKKAGLAHYVGGVVVDRAQDQMRADDMVGHLSEENRIEKIDARGNAYLRASGRVEATAPALDFLFAENNQLKQALGTGGAHMHWLGDGPARDVTGERIDIAMAPGAQGAEMRHAVAEGQSVVTYAAPVPTASAPNPAARELRADRVDLDMLPGGQFAKKADAEGNAVLTITPVKAEPKADRKRVTAPHMHMAFFDADNLAREFTADGGVKVELEPLAAGSRAPRTTTSETADATFERESQDFARVEQAGEFKYVEGERNGTAGTGTYVKADDTVALRGQSSAGRPTVWDSKGRTQADEIDIHSTAGTSQGRGDVRTTYYSPASTGGAAPFGNTKSPVFVTAQAVDSRQADGGVAVYTGAARAWQDDNYVKADTIRLFDAARRMEAEGNVESGLYQAKMRDGETGTAQVPVFTTAPRMRYSDADRLVHYEGGVVSRQAPDVITSDAQDVWLTAGQPAEVDHMIAEGNVVVTEPTRKGSGSKLVYTAADQKSVLTGSNARVEDAAQGTSTGSELTFYMGGDRIHSVGQGAGRVKTTHRIRGKESQ